ncbi:DUF805 domain-containing protein [Marimonas lutisalis]|uniref:DUF805 domain-containing protein n=1 Tax=Marimonas lutisalis TaxID=2545756 RepID=UPI0010F6CF2D|nr:DUF805 domain-containing protein [Marimonas lutisalis]
MDFKTAVKTCLTEKYATFSGRASRSEYWWFALAMIIGAVVVSLIETAIFGAPAPGQRGTQPLSMLYSLALIIPITAAGFRRLHDSGRPGWYILIPLVISIFLNLTLLGGIFGVALMEQGQGIDPDMAAGVALAGGIGALIAMLLMIVLTILMIWWLTRPSDHGDNAYGPPPADQRAV